MRRAELGVAASLVIAVSGASAHATPAFVQVRGTRFVKGNRPFHFVGANVGVLHGPQQRKKAQSTLRAVRADGLRVVRIWALGEGSRTASKWRQRWTLFRVGPAGWLPAAVRHLDRVLAWCQKLGLRAILVLANHWGDYGGLPRYLQWAGLLPGTPVHRFFTHARTRQWYRAHLVRLLGRKNRVTGRHYARDPTIMAWELFNESSILPAGFSARRQFIQSMARLIRKRAPHHLVAAGVNGYATRRRRTEWLKVCRLPEISYCDSHLYPGESWRLKRPKDLGPLIDDRVQLAHHVAKKPIVFGEFSFAPRTRGLLGKSRAWWFRAFLRQVWRDGAAGALAWIYLPRSKEKRRYAIWVDAKPSPTRQALRHATRNFNKGPPSLINPRLGARKGSALMYPSHFTVKRSPSRGVIWKKTRSGHALALPPNGFVRARFESMGFYRGGLLQHFYGDGSGEVRFRIPRLGRPARALKIRLRLSSQFPGASAPPTGTSRVEVWLGRRLVRRLTAPPDNGLGRVFRLKVKRRSLLRRLRWRGLVLRLRVKPGPNANGLCVYGGRGKRAPRKIYGPVGPIRILALR